MTGTIRLNSEKGDVLAHLTPGPVVLSQKYFLPLARPLQGSPPVPAHGVIVDFAELSWESATRYRLLCPDCVHDCPPGPGWPGVRGPNLAEECHQWAAGLGWAAGLIRGVITLDNTLPPHMLL